MFGQIDEIKNLAFKYSKQELGRMVQMGMVDPQKAMMAGMMRDRVSQEDAKPPTTTVAQDVLGTAPQMQQPAQPQQPQMGMPQAPAPQAPTQMAATGGVTSLPVHEQDYAGGGIVAFADGGDTDDGVAHFDGGGFNFPQGSLLGMYERRQTAGGDAMDELQNLDAAIAKTPSGPALDLLLKRREFAAAKAAKANTQAFPSGTIAPPDGQQAQQTFAPTVPGASDSVATPFGNETPTGIAAAPGAPKVNADKAPAGGAPATPRLPALNRPSGKIDVQDYTAAAPKDIDTILAEQQEVYKKQGIEDPYKGLSEKTEKKRDELGTRKEQAKGEFLMNVGLGLTQATRGQEVAGLGKGAMQGMAAYKDAMKDVRAAEDKLEDRLDSYKLAEYQAKKTGTDAAIAKRDSMLEKVDAAKNKTIDAKNAAAAKGEEIKAHVYGYEIQAQTQKEVANIHANTQKEMNTLVKQGQLDAKIAQVLLTSEKNFMDANAMSYVGKPQELARDAREHAMEAARAYLPGSAAAKSAPAPAPAPTADLYKNKYGITPTKG